ncbi:hypothetical protein PENARI_c005G12561 [Penicillium arizonense]|uniref:Secreted protein n=1 Tax=Penicillium arizonense TaxID=1835702 RepID=A0A1F5LP61_PENAI|nr:hypothetical protein PENARI_c005G12561 [Penicillium arizonense]OGE54915.1 hypothetical protein PENARI_c005G12561 [Penicillium arizonense]
MIIITCICILLIIQYGRHHLLRLAAHLFILCNNPILYHRRRRPDTPILCNNPIIHHLRRRRQDTPTLCNLLTLIRFTLNHLQKRTVRHLPDLIDAPVTDPSYGK